MLEGDLQLPHSVTGMVLFAHGSGSGRHSPRNRFVAEELHAAGLGTLLIDLLTESEEAADRLTGHLRFNIALLAERLIAAKHWLGSEPSTAALSIGYFGASTGGAAALVAAATEPEGVAAVVSRGGRPDLAGASLPRVRAPTLLIVGQRDPTVLELNRAALTQLRTEVRLDVVPEATHLFEEPGALQAVAGLARNWFLRFLSASG